MDEFANELLIKFKLEFAQFSSSKRQTMTLFVNLFCVSKITKSFLTLVFEDANTNVGFFSSVYVFRKK